MAAYHGKGLFLYEPSYENWEGENLRSLNKIRKEVGLGELKTQMRNCLRCEKEFESTNNGNRMCHHCRGLSAYEP